MAVIEPSKQGYWRDVWWKLMTVSGVLLLVFAALSV